MDSMSLADCRRCWLRYRGRKPHLITDEVLDWAANEYTRKVEAERGREFRAAYPTFLSYLLAQGLMS